MQKFFFVSLLALITAGSFYLSSLQTKQDEEGYSLSRLPLASFTREDDSEYKLATNSKYQIVHFWATWCGPCEAELPELIKLAASLKDLSEIHFVIVAVNDDKLKVKKFLSTIPQTSLSNLDFVFDQNNIHSSHFGTYKLPETFLFDRDARLIKKFVGPQNWSTSLLTHYIKDIDLQNIPSH